MGEYRVRFIKRLCNDVGLQRNCLQGLVDVRRAKTAERAVQAAQKRFERSKRISDWRVYADICEVAPEEFDRDRDLNLSIRL
jgi:F0F1-type ATP synthase delta subunit